MCVAIGASFWARLSVTIHIRAARPSGECESEDALFLVSSGAKYSTEGKTGGAEIQESLIEDLFMSLRFSL